jgi:hypothetical protein
MVREVDLDRIPEIELDKRMDIRACRGGPWLLYVWYKDLAPNLAPETT